MARSSVAVFALLVGSILACSRTAEQGTSSTSATESGSSSTSEQPDADTDTDEGTDTDTGEPPLEYDLGNLVPPLGWVATTLQPWPEE